MTSLISATKRDVVMAAARKIARTPREIPAGLGLSLNEAKTNCMLLDPAYLHGEVFERTPHLGPIYTAARIRGRV